jgi:hypothetical protein
VRPFDLELGPLGRYYREAGTYLPSLLCVESLRTILLDLNSPTT